MGTTSLIRFFGKGSQTPLVVFYQQYDGYPSCVGLELAKFLKSRKLVNGFRFETDFTVANGVGCLSAQFCTHSKTRAGHFYITDVDSSDEMWNYNVYVDDISLDIEIKVDDGKLMTVDEFYNFCITPGYD